MCPFDYEATFIKCPLGPHFKSHVLLIMFINIFIVQKELRQKHQKLKGLLEKEKACLSRDSVNTSMATPSVTTPMTTPPTNTSTASAERVCAAESPIKPDVYNKGWNVWEETVASTKPDGMSPYQYNGYAEMCVHMCGLL